MPDSPFLANLATATGPDPSNTNTFFSNFSPSPNSFICCDSTYCIFFANVFMIPESTTHTPAKTNPHWVSAMENELLAL